jgi:prephenate dehydrogenase
MLFKNPLVIGYKGEVGSFFLHGLLRVMPKARYIWCYDINETEQEKIQRINTADCIFLCLPIHLTKKWFVHYRKYITGKTVIEQTSIKNWALSKTMVDIGKECRIIHMHLLFRPSATEPSERRCAFVKSQWVTKRLVNTIRNVTRSGILFYSSIEEHDYDMAGQQALVHRTILALSDVIGKSPKTFISKKVNEIAHRIRQTNKTLFRKIQANPYKSEWMGKLRKQLAEECVL